MSICMSGWNGERKDPVSGMVHAGNGYRAYNPVLMRFNCPDTWSPFGAGGIHPYLWCMGDPINRADPSGHMSWQSLTGIAAGVIGLALLPVTLGQSLTVMTCIIAGTEAVSGVTAIASAVVQARDPKASSVLGWISFGTGILSLGEGLISAGYQFLRQAKKFTDTMVMSLDSEFQFIASFGRTTRRGVNPDAMMSVIFEDRVESAAHATYRRLNVWAHGRRPDRIFIDGQSMTADMLIEQLAAANIDLADYDAIQFISCNSVNLARAFTERTTLTATGFRGAVAVQGHAVSALRQMSEEVDHLPSHLARVRFPQAVEQYPSRATASGINIFEDRQFFRVVRGHPISFRRQPEPGSIIEQMEGFPLPNWYGLR